MILALCASASSSYAQSRFRSNQSENPIYIADSPIAQDSLIRLNELVQSNNLEQATRLAQQIIIEHGDRLIKSQSSDVYILVRKRINAFVRNHPDLLTHYRRAYTPIAQSMLNEDWKRVSIEYQLTQPGLIGSLNHAQELIESGSFHSGIRVLEQLIHHPDAPMSAQRAFSIIMDAAPKLNDSSVWDLVDQWALLAELNVPKRTPGSRSTQSQRPVHSQSSVQWNTIEQSEISSIDGLVPSPLGEQQLTPEPELDTNIPQPNIRSSGANWLPTSWVSPLIVNDSVYTNDGITISCFDRFTLRPQWRIQTSNNLDDLPVSSIDRERVGRAIEDTTSIVYDQGSIFSATGLPRSGTRNGNARVMKIHAHTGKTQWSINPRMIDDSLSNASVRGHLVIENDTLVVGARTNNRKQRLIQLTLIGLDTNTGETKWIREIGSAGSLPFQQVGQLAHTPILDNGVVYWTDHIGLACALEVSTGAIIWARPLPSPDLYDRFTRPSFANSAPVINQHGLFILSSDGTEIFQLDQSTGEILATRPADPIGESLYLLDINNDIACIGTSKISIYSSSRFETCFIKSTPTLGGSLPIRGRVITQGDQLLVPIDSGIDIIDQHSLNKKQHLRLGVTGNIAISQGQLLVVNQSSISSFLAWDIASELLSQRMKTDPKSSIALAELAYKSAQSNDLLSLVQQALQIVRESDQNHELSGQLFEVVLSMINPSVLDDRSWISDSMQSELFSILESLTRTDQQILAHRMAWGKWNTNQQDFARAIKAYQDILDQPNIRSEMWSGAGLIVRGDLEAKRRIGELIQAHGYALYTNSNQLSSAQRAFLGESPEPDDLETIAQQFPWGRSTPGYWLQASSLWRSENQISASIQASRNGIECVISLLDLGIQTQQSTIDQLADHAISGLIETNNTVIAQSISSELIERFPEFILKVQGRPVDPDQLLALSNVKSQFPLIGDRFIRDTNPYLVKGSPIKPVHRIDQGGVLLYAPQFGTLEYVRAGRGLFETIWSRESPTNENPLIPWQSETRTVIFWPAGSSTPDTGTLEAIETTTGRTVWKIEDLQIKLAQTSDRIPDDIARLDGQFETPLHSVVRTNQVITLTDGHTILVTDRTGRAMGIDLHSGDELWNNDLPTNRVHDIDISGGVIGVCGLSIIDDAQNQQNGARNSIAASIDPRTGQVIQIIERFGQSPRWVRATPHGNIVVSSQDRILSINTKAGGIDWMINEEYLMRTQGSWIVGDQIAILNEDSEVFLVTLTQGNYSTKPLDTRGYINDQGWMRAQSINTKEHPRSILLTGSIGCMIYSKDGELNGIDPILSNRTYVDFAQGLERIAGLERAYSENGSTISTLHLFDTNSNLLDSLQIMIPETIDRRATSLSAIRGGFILGFNEVSIFIRAPKTIQ